MTTWDHPSLEKALKNVLRKKQCRSQQEIAKELDKKGFAINQSTISRTLKKIGGFRSIGSDGRPLYVFDEAANTVNTKNLSGMITRIRHNENCILIHTHPGCASLVAKVIDEWENDSVIGTIAGDDTVIVVPTSIRRIRESVRYLAKKFSD